MSGRRLRSVAWSATAAARAPRTPLLAPLLAALAASGVAAQAAAHPPAPAVTAESAASPVVPAPLAVPSAPADTSAGPPAPAVAPSLFRTGSRAGQLRRVFREDRLAHASLGVALGVGIGMMSREPAAGAGCVITLGLAKELSDARIDRGDLAAGALGAGLAALIVASLTR